MFIRPEMHSGSTHDIDKAILKLDKPCAKELLAYYKSAFSIGDAQIAEYQEKYHETVSMMEETLAWLRKLLQNYSLVKKQV